MTEEEIIANNAYKRFLQEKEKLLEMVEKQRSAVNRWRGIIAAAKRPGMRALAADIITEYLEETNKPVSFRKGLEIAERFGAELDPITAEQDFSRSIKVAAGKGTILKVKNDLIGLASWEDSRFK